MSTLCVTVNGTVTVGAACVNDLSFSKSTVHPTGDHTVMEKNINLHIRRR